MTDIIQTEITKALSKTLGSAAGEFSHLIADKIRYLRWKSAVQTLEKAEQFAKPYGGLRSVPPLKFFLPFMENCSLEEEDEDVVDMWANLLVSASNDFKPGHLLFMRLLREITGSEARLLRDIAHSGTEKPVSRADLEAAGANWETFSAPSSPLRGVDIGDWEIARKTVFDELQLPGIAVEHLELARSAIPQRALRRESIESLVWMDSILDHHERISLEILVSLNLVERIPQQFSTLSEIPPHPPIELEGVAVCITAMGVAFYVACSSTEVS